jgi:osmoprotectant transport system substrate-binding protein
MRAWVGWRNIWVRSMMPSPPSAARRSVISRPGIWRSVISGLLGWHGGRDGVSRRAQGIARRTRGAGGMMRFLALFPVLALLLSCGPARSDRIVVGCKNFTEQLILGEIIAQQAILGGRIDVYPEYTGTALTAVLKQAPRGSEEVYGQVKVEYAQRFNLVIGLPFGFNDTFAIEIRGEDARRLGVQTISQAAPFTPHWRAGFGYEFMERPDGYKGLAATYGLRFAEPPRVMDLGLITRALQEKQVDLIAGNMTDGLIPTLDLYVLDDDKHYFPPYQAVPVMRQEALAKHPQLQTALDQLKGQISDADMRRLNYAADGQHRDVKQIAREFLRSRGLGP